MTIDVEVGEVECYYEELDVGERLTLSYEVRNISRNERTRHLT